MAGNNTDWSMFTKDDLLLRYNDREANFLLPVIIYVSTLMIAGVVGNGLVIYIYKLRFRRSSSRTFILCLAFLDMAACACGMPFHIWDMLHPYIFYSSAACKTLSFVMSVVILASNFVLVLIACDRYQKICKPFQRQISDYGTKSACVVLIFLAVIFAVPHLILYGERSVEIEVLNITGTECYISDDYVDTIFPLAYTGILLLIFLSSVIVLSTLYCLVGLKVWRRGISTGQSQRKTSNGSYSWKFCGNTNETVEDDVFTDDNNGNTEMKSTPDDTIAKRENEQNDVFNSPIYKKPVTDDTRNVNQSDTRNGTRNLSQSNKTNGTLPQDSKNSKNSKSVPARIGSKTEKGSVAKNKENKKRLKRVFSTSESEEPDFKTNKTDLNNGMRRSRFDSANSSFYNSPKRQKRAVRITIMLFIITLVYVISFLPFVVITVLDSLDETFWTGENQHQNALFNFFLRTYFINNMVNPIIYGFLDTKFRAETASLFKKACACK